MSVRGLEELWKAAEASKASRAERMPTERDAVRLMWHAYQRLTELGWDHIMYCPKDGSTFDAIEAGSTGIHACRYMGEWPDGSWWIAEAGDLWPAHPILFRLRKETNHEA